MFIKNLSFKNLLIKKPLFNQSLNHQTSINSKNQLTFIFAFAASILAFLFFSASLLAHQTSDHKIVPPKVIPKPAHIHDGRPKIQLAILLDTSGSMDGLIDQTRNQLWQVVNEFSTAKRFGIRPILEVALLEYGNDGNAKRQGFVRMLNRFTRELDEVSEGLFSLTTNGGSEYCGFAIKTAVKSLNWSHSPNDIKSIFIAGNEPFTQGPVNYQEAIQLARNHGIAVNTIHAGNHQEGIDTGWQRGALLAGGEYMSIDADQESIHIIAPQDKRIAELNRRLNKTYVPYGVSGSRKAKRQLEQDEASAKISAGLLAKRARSKSSSYYNNSKWDLVDAFEDGSMSDLELATIEPSTLPEPMQEMAVKERKDYVLKKAKERALIKEEIKTLSEQRKAYVAAEKKKQLASAPAMSDALTKAIKKQAQEKSYTFETDDNS